MYTCTLVSNTIALYVVLTYLHGFKFCVHLPLGCLVHTSLYGIIDVIKSKDKTSFRKYSTKINYSQVLVFLYCPCFLVMFMYDLLVLQTNQQCTKLISPSCFFFKKCLLICWMIVTWTLYYVDYVIYISLQLNFFRTILISTIYWLPTMGNVQMQS